MIERLRVGGMVLCGGSSLRMGLSKATLPFGPELMLQRVVRLLAEAVQPIVVVAAVGQQLPELPPATIVARDQRRASGPLEGLRVGLTALADHADAAYATSCDVPLLVPALVMRMIAELGEQVAAVPVDGQFLHPLAAVYRTRTAARMQQLLDQGQRRTSALFDVVPTKFILAGELRDIDPELRTLMNVNTPADYVRALELANLPVDAAVREQLGL